ncbi:hypothetical protein [Archangium gephyra]|uniref:hypothetical protein n=1 Tax=Archangium gephyra TaxID=48 RepID=UPI00064AE23D|nr:hypothetical protein [Archangium gephyra]
MTARFRPQQWGTRDKWSVYEPGEGSPCGSWTASLRSALATTAAGCTRELTESTRPCPRIEGWTCCAGKQVFSQRGCKGPVQAEVTAVPGPTTAAPTWFEAPLEAAP